MQKMPITSHLPVVACLIPALLFVGVGVYFISGFHVWPLSRDQWHMYAPYFQLGLWDALLQPMSSHRHIFPFFFFHLDMAFFHGMNHFLVACGAGFNTLIVALFQHAYIWVHMAFTETPDMRRIYEPTNGTS